MVDLLGLGHGRMAISAERHMSTAGLIVGEATRRGNRNDFYGIKASNVGGGLPVLGECGQLRILEFPNP